MGTWGLFQHVQGTNLGACWKKALASRENRGAHSCGRLLYHLGPAEGTTSWLRFTRPGAQTVNTTVATDACVGSQACQAAETLDPAQFSGPDHAPEHALRGALQHGHNNSESANLKTTLDRRFIKLTFAV